MATSWHGSPKYKPAYRLVQALGTLDDPAAADVLVAVVKRGSKSGMSMAAEPLDDMILRGQPDTLDAMLRHTLDVSQGAAAVLARHAESRLQAPQPALRLGAIGRLLSGGEERDKHARAQLLMGALEDPDPAIVHAAIDAFFWANLAPEKITELVMPLLARSDAAVVAAAVRVLPADHLPAADALIAALSHPDTAVVDTAAAVLSRCALDHEASERMVEALSEAARRHGERLIGPLSSGPSGRRALGVANRSEPQEVALACTVCGAEATRYLVYPPFAERPMGGRAPITDWGWGPAGDPCAATGDATEDVRRGHLVEALAAAHLALLESRSTSAWSALRDAVCPVCGASACGPHRTVDGCGHQRRGSAVRAGSIRVLPSRRGHHVPVRS